MDCVILTSCLHPLSVQHHAAYTADMKYAPDWLCVTLPQFGAFYPLLTIQGQTHLATVPTCPYHGPVPALRLLEVKAKHRGSRADRPVVKSWFYQFLAGQPQQVTQPL